MKDAELHRVRDTHQSLYEKYSSSLFMILNIPHFSKIQEAYERMSYCYKYWYSKFLPRHKDSKILDIGCGMGHFIYFLKKMGYTNYLGIDISPEQVAFVKKFITDKVLLIDASTFLNNLENEYDVIVMNDVLEHIPKSDIINFLSLVRKALKDDGIVFIKTVNAANPFNFRGRYIDFTHEIAFTEHSLVQVLKIAGFRVIALFGDECPRPGLKGTLDRFAKKIFFLIMRKLFQLQEINPPNILDKNIIAIASKA